MQLSVIVPFFGFQPQREAALLLLMDSIAAQDLRVCDAKGDPTEAKDFEVLFVEQECEAGFHTLPNLPHIRHIKLPKQKAFNKSWCMNVGAREASTGSLIFLDVDMLFGKAFFSKIWYFHRNNKTPYFNCWSYIVSLPGKDLPVTKIIERDILTAGGAFFVDRTFFWSVGGMNENYFGYGGEDNDLWVRVNLKLGVRGQFNVVSMPYALGHCYHDWSEPSPERFYHLNRTIQFPEQVTHRLVKQTLGLQKGPTLVDVSDLKLKTDGIEAGGKGLI